MTVCVWRIATDTPDYTADELSGTGARITGGRWNRAGIAVTYASDSIALACLETLVNLGAHALPFNRYLLRIEIPEDVFARRITFEDINAASARVGWDALPAGKVSIDTASNWLLSGRSAILDVPSVILPEERNYLIDPAHADSALIVAVKLRRFGYDSRLG
ncbi:RES domain-containing protein [Rhodocyclus purpureus]|uniref:type II RES/Xre toxin-antitoxin system toxin n=1 Tax=Rhodocyclus purpureus TaxID=1067 RepID=UPI0019136555|nr:hypothetical protein [Rhodocyclus purpureus]